MTDSATAMEDQQLMSTPSPVGRITRISVTYTADTPDGPRHAIVGLPAMHRCSQPGRLTELLDDLAVIVEDAITSGSGMAHAALVEQIRRRAT
jgi:hypothetical protein